MIWGGVAILRIMLAILRLDTFFLSAISSERDHFYDLFFVTCLKAVTTCEFLNHEGRGEWLFCADGAVLRDRPYIDYVS